MQLVTCADTCLTAAPGVESSIPARVIDHELISTGIFLPPTDSRRVVVSNKQRILRKKSLAIFFEDSQLRRNRTFYFIMSINFPF